MPRPISDDGTRMRALARTTTRCFHQFTVRVALYARIVASGNIAATSDFGPCFTFPEAVPESTLDNGRGEDDGLRADGVGVDFVESTSRYFFVYGSTVDVVENAAWGFFVHLVLAAAGLRCAA